MCEISNIADIHNKGSIKKNTENLAIILKDYNDFWTELKNIKQCNKSLFQDFIMWPNETEWRPVETFKNPEFQWSLKDRLDAFKDRLNSEHSKSEHSKYENVINCYCRLYQELGKNPCNINKSSDIEANFF